MTRSTLLLAMASAMCVSSTQAAQVLWQDDAPLTPPSVTANLIVNTVDASGITADPSRTAVGDVILTGAAKFVSVNSGALVLPAGSDDQPFSLSLDYFVPNGTTLDALPGGSSPDLFWLQIGFDGGNDGSIGFIGAGAAGNGWNTLTLTGTVPNGATDIIGSLVLADGGFGAGTPNGTGTGTALFIDNIRLEVDAIPEPTSFVLMAVGACGLVARRR